MVEINKRRMIGNQFTLSLLNVSLEFIVEESQFEQSVFFNKNMKKKGNEDHRLLEKIQEYGGDEEDREMIVGKIDEF